MLVRLSAAGWIREEDTQRLKAARPVHLAIQLGYRVSADEWHQDPDTWALRRFPQRFVRLLRRELLANTMSIGTAARMTALAEEDIVDLLRSQPVLDSDAAELEYFEASV